MAVTILTTALAWRYSPHQRGKSSDADFRFLIQSSSVSLISIATLGIPIWKSSSRATIWVFLALASLCAVFAPLMYLFAPTEWSAFMGIIAGIVQAVTMLQIALGDRVGVKVIKKD